MNDGKTPERIWIYEDAWERSWLEEELPESTEYIRADIHAAEVERLKEEVERLKSRETGFERADKASAALKAYADKVQKLRNAALAATPNHSP